MKVAICGLGPAKSQLPVRWDGERNNYQPKRGVEVWSLNNSYNDPFLGRVCWTRYFELHRVSWLRKHYGAQGFKQHVLQLRGRALLDGIRIVTWGHWPDGLPSEFYPRAAVNRLTAHPWHASSFDWLVALAIYERATHISLHGIDMGPMDQGEPWAAFGALSYWLGIAEGRGIKVSVEGGSLFTTLQWLRSRKLQYGWHDVDNIIDGRVKERPKRKASKIMVVPVPAEAAIG